MKKLFANFRKQNLIYICIILGIGAITYLLFINRLGFYGDDWYLIFDGHTQGPAFFKYVYGFDRPARGFVMYFIYSLFGDHLIYYHLSAFLFRFLASVILFWTLNAVWKNKNFFHFLIALLFMIFPGFLSQIQPVDYQSEILSLFLAMVSIALTIKAIQVRSSLVLKIILFFFSIVTGLFYLALVEYLLGFEFLRLFLVACLIWQEENQTFKQKIYSVFFHWLPASVIPTGIIVWFLFIFKSTRGATNLGAQLGFFAESPLLRGLHWTLNELYGIFNMLFSVWVVPTYRIVLIGEIRLKEIGYLIGIGIAAVLIFSLGLWIIRHNLVEEKSESKWRKQILFGGLVSVAVGIIPIILANRTVTPEIDMSRYTLTGAVGSIMVVVALVSSLKSTRLQLGIVGGLVFVIVTTHIGNTLNFVKQADSYRDFWWQVSWRAPQILRGTTIVASNPASYIPEDYDIWAPANLIYYPEKSDAIPVPIQLPAALAYGGTVNDVLGEGSHDARNERNSLVKLDWNSMLVITKPDANSCARILDNTIPELSPEDANDIKLLAPFSKIDRISVNDIPAIPPSLIFGPEPAHTWCYYYEKMTLARQSKDWQSMADLSDEAMAHGLRPSDRTEWIPLLQAYVATNQIDKLKPYPILMNQFPMIRIQNCQILKQTAAEVQPNNDEIKNFIEKNFCPPYPEN